MIRAGYGFDGAPSTGTPPAHSIAARMSESEPPHLPSARTGRIQPFQPSPAMPRELFASAPMIPGDARAVPGTVALLAGAEHPARRLRRRHPVAGIGRIRVPAVAVVRLARVTDEVEARQQPASLTGPQKVRVIVANAGVEVRDDHARAAGREIPRVHGIDGARSRGRVLQIPLAREQRIVRHRVRETSEVGLGELDVRVGAQDREIRVHVRSSWPARRSRAPAAPDRVGAPA